MCIPTIIDEQFDRVVGVAASPVAVFFEVADSAPCAASRRVFERMAEEYDDRVIFLRIFVDENPTICYREKIEPPNCPSIIVYKRKKPIGSLIGAIDADGLGKLLEQAISVA